MSGEKDKMPKGEHLVKKYDENEPPSTSDNFFKNYTQGDRETPEGEMPKSVNPLGLGGANKDDSLLTSAEQQKTGGQTLANSGGINQAIDKAFQDLQRGIGFNQQPDPSTGALPTQTYYPTAGINPIKGAYGGSVVGNVPLIAPSILFPMGVYDAKQKAAEMKAAQKKADIDKFYKEFAMPDLKRKSVQSDFSKVYQEGFEQFYTEAKRLSPNNPTEYLSQSQAFRNWHTNVRDMAQMDNFAVDRIAEIYKQAEKDDFVIPADVATAMNEFMAGRVKITDPKNAESVASYRELYESLETEYNLAKAANQAIDKAVAQISEKYGVSSKDAYDILTSTEEKVFAEATLNAAADAIYEQKFRGSKRHTQESIRKYMKDMFGAKEQKLTVQTASKGAMYGKKIYTKADIQTGVSDGIQAVARVNKVTGEQEMDENGFPVTVPNVYARKSVLMIPDDNGILVKNSKAVINARTGNRESETKIVAGKAQQIEIVGVYKKGSKGTGGNDITGMIVPKDKFDESVSKGLVEYRPVVNIKSLETPPGTTEKIESDRYVDLKEVRGALKGVPEDVFDELEKISKAETSKLPKAAAASQPQAPRPSNNQSSQSTNNRPVFN